MHSIYLAVHIWFDEHFVLSETDSTVQTGWIRPGASKYYMYSTYCTCMRGRNHQILGIGQYMYTYGERYSQIQRAGGKLLLCQLVQLVLGKWLKPPVFSFRDPGMHKWVKNDVSPEESRRVNIFPGRSRRDVGSIGSCISNRLHKVRRITI